MKPTTDSPVHNAEAEISALIETLAASEQRLEELTGGEVDTVVARNGRTFLLQRAQEQVRHSEAAKQAALLNDLIESNKKFHQLANNITDVFWIRSPDMREVQYISPAFERIWGRSVASLQANPHEWSEFIFSEDRQRVLEAFSELTGDVAALDIEYRIVRPAGDIRWIHVRGFQVRDEANELINHTGIVTDITDRKGAEETLKASQASMATAQCIGHFGSWEMDLGDVEHVDENALRWSDEMYRIAGYQPGEVKVTNELFFRLVPEEDHGPIQQAVAAAIHGGGDYTIIHRLVRPDGEVRIVQEMAQIFADEKTGRPVKIVGTAHDITARRQADAALEASQRRLRDIIDGLGPSIFVGLMTPDGVLVECNRPALATAGLRPEDVIGKPFEETYWWSHSAEVQQMLRTAIVRAAAGEASRFDVQICVTEGQLIDADFSIQPLCDENGKVAFLVPSASVITERKRAEELLRQKTVFLEAQVNSTIDGVLVVDPQGKKILQNQRVADLLKIPQHVADDPDDEQQVRWVTGMMKNPDLFIAKVVHLYAHPGEVSRDEIELKDGTILDRYSSPVVGENGENYGRIWTFRDITEQRMLARTAEDSLHRLEEAQRLGQMGDWEWDIATGAITWSPQVFEILGRDPILGPPRNYEESAVYYDAASVALMTAKVGQAIESGEEQEYEMVALRNGQRLDVQAKAVPTVDKSGKVVGLHGTLQDISAMKRSEAALQESQLRYHSLFENMLEGYAYCETVFDGDELLDFIYLEVNSAFGALTGLTDVVGKRISEVAPGMKEANRDTFELYGRVALNGKPEKVETYLEGFGIWISVTVYSSNRGHFVAVFDDITARKLAETEASRSTQELFESEEKFRQLADNISDVFWVTSPDLTVVHYISAGYKQIWGRSADSLYANPHQWIEAIWPEDLDRVVGVFSALMAGEPEVSVEYRISRPDGTVRWVHDRGFQVLDAQGKLVRLAGIVADITDRKSLQEQFLQSQKMESLGSLAGGIAHDFNNLLTGMMGYAELAQMKLPTDSAIQADLEEIRKSAERAASLTKQLLAFARKEVIDPQVVNPHDLVQGLENLLRRLVGVDIQLITRSSNDLGRVKVDPSSFEQVLVNLAVNARDAMPQGGKLILATQDMTVTDVHQTHGGVLQPGPYVVISVTDTGTGMTKEVQARAFDPFYTTKEKGKGTGLGLSTCYGIVANNGGHIWLYSEVGVGTTFRIYLPRVFDSLSAQEPEEQVIEGGRGETVLVVEDEDSVRALAVDVLSLAGYNVIQAPNGKAAIKLVATYKDQIHIMVTDVVMPEMSGRELSEFIEEARPDTKVLFISGFTDDEILREGAMTRAFSFLQKPFSPVQLARKVREVLDLNREVEATA